MLLISYHLGGVIFVLIADAAGGMVYLQVYEHCERDNTIHIASCAG